MGRDDVDKTEDWNKRHTDEPHDDLLPQRQRLQETHLRAVPDARQMLLAVGMRYKLQPQHRRHWHHWSWPVAIIKYSFHL